MHRKSALFPSRLRQPGRRSYGPTTGHSPGRAPCPQRPLRRAAKPDEIARAVTFLASDGIEYLTGCVLDANGASYLRT